MRERCTASTAKASGRDLDQEIAAARRVDGVARRAREAELPLARATPTRSSGEATARNRTAAERALRWPARQRVGEPPPIAPQHFLPSHQVMREPARLRPLEVRVGGHQHVELGLRAREQHRGEPIDGGERRFAEPTAIKPEIGRDLVVPRTPRVELAADGADELGEARFDVHVHVFAIAPEHELAALDLLADASEPLDDGVRLSGGDDAGPVARPRA